MVSGVQQSALPAYALPASGPLNTLQPADLQQVVALLSQAVLLAQQAVALLSSQSGTLPPGASPVNGVAGAAGDSTLGGGAAQAVAGMACCNDAPPTSFGASAAPPAAAVASFGAAAGPPAGSVAGSQGGGGVVADPQQNPAGQSSPVQQYPGQAGQSPAGKGNGPGQQGNAPGGSVGQSPVQQTPVGQYPVDQSPVQQSPDAGMPPSDSSLPTPESVHMTQFRSKYEPDGPSRSPDCGVVSTVMALRLAGLDVPGHHGEKSYQVIKDARRIGTGSLDQRGTTTRELARIVTAAGGKTTYTHSMATIESWAQAGSPVILNGNAARAWDKRYSTRQVSHFDGSHAVTLSGYDQKSGNYIINDPLSRIGAIQITRTELKQFLSENGGGGLRVQPAQRAKSDPAVGGAAGAPAPATKPKGKPAATPKPAAKPPKH